MEDPHVLLENYNYNLLDEQRGFGDAVDRFLDQKSREVRQSNCPTRRASWIIMYWRVSLNDPVGLTCTTPS